MGKPNRNCVKDDRCWENEAWSMAMGVEDDSFRVLLNWKVWVMEVSLGDEILTAVWGWISHQIADPHV